MTAADDVDEYLACAAEGCDHEVWISPEDPDASLSEMCRHLRSQHPDQDAHALLAKARVTR